MSYHLFLTGYELELVRRLFHLYSMSIRVTVTSKHHEFIAMNAATAMRLCFSIFLRWALPSIKWSSLKFEGLRALSQIDPRHIESNCHGRKTVPSKVLSQVHLNHPDVKFTSTTQHSSFTSTTRRWLSIRTRKSRSESGFYQVKFTLATRRSAD